MMSRRADTRIWQPIRGSHRGFRNQSAGATADSGTNPRDASAVLGYCVARGPNQRVVAQIKRKGGVQALAEVKIQEGESIESALRRFKRKVQQEDIIKDIKKHSFYLKPGDKRRAKQALARKRSRKKQRRELE
jgi:small subunit ribosomal protein S21